MPHAYMVAVGPAAAGTSAPTAVSWTYGSGPRPGRGVMLTARQESINRRLSPWPGPADGRGRRAGGAQRRDEPHAGRLLERVGERDQPRLAPPRADEGQADREPEDRAGRDRDGRVAGHRGRPRGVEDVVVAEVVVGQPGRAGGQRDDGVQPEGGERALQGLPGAAGRLFPRGLVPGVAQVATGGFRPLEQLLAEPGQHAPGMVAVVRDELGQRG